MTADGRPTAWSIDVSLLQTAIADDYKMITTSTELKVSGNTQPPTSRTPSEAQSNSLNGHVFNIPTEILCVIFIFARDLSLLPDSKRFKSLPCEIVISHVCKLWRMIALDLPQLWNTYRYTPPRSLHVKIISRFSTYVERSGAQTLDIWLNFRGDHASKWVDIHRALLHATLEQGTRWRRYTILLDDTLRQETLVEHYKSLKILYNSHLEHFAFCPIRPPRFLNASKEALFSPRLLPFGAPALKSIRLDSNSFYHYLPPISGLTTLRIDSPTQYVSNTTVSLHSFAPVLQISTLQNLSISGINIQEDLTDGVPLPHELVMKSLQELRCSSADVIELFQYIHTPQLETLVLKRADFPILLPKSVSSLTSLVLINCSVPWKRLSREMTHISERITHLTVSEQSSGIFHRDALLCFDPTENLWPNLVHLGCNIQTATHLEFYLQFAELRSPVPLTLHVHQNLLELWGVRSPSQLSSLQDICKLKSWDNLRPLVPYHWPYKEDGADFGYDRTDYDPFGVIPYT